MAGRQYAFVLRILIEPGTGSAHPVIRGSLELVQAASHIRYFSSLDELITMLEASVGLAHNDRPRPPAAPEREQGSAGS